MIRTVIGIFDTSDALQAVREALTRLGIGDSALRFASLPPAAVESLEAEQARPGSVGSGLRNFLSELFGTEHPDEAGHYSEGARHGRVALAVEVPAGMAVAPIRDILTNGGAVEIDERLGSWRSPGSGGEEEESLPAGPAASPAVLRPYEEYEPDYRKDFQLHYAAPGTGFEDYAPAYHYGYALAEDPRYRGWDWAAIEPEAQRDWESQYPESTWRRFREAIRHGWERATGK
ncbi:MAG TPA: hypothetical protein VJ576_20000 [Rhodocyclaceae bacterium]|nr:hypothetical protein [Rhodocyclaceae bacterium]